MTISGDSWIALAIIVVVVLVIALMIGGVLKISGRDKGHKDDGPGILDEDEDGSGR